MCGAFDQHYHLCVLIVRLHEQSTNSLHTQLHIAQLECFNMMLHEPLSLVANAFQPVLLFVSTQNLFK